MTLEAREQRRGLGDAEADRGRLGEHADEHDLDSRDQPGAREDQRADVEGERADPHRTNQQGEEGHKAHRRERQARE